MRIELDCIVEDKGGYVAYVQLKDADGKILACAIVPYEEGNTEALKKAATEKFRSIAVAEMAKEAKMQDIRSTLETTLSEIDVAAEVATSQINEGELK